MRIEREEWEKVQEKTYAEKSDTSLDDFLQSILVQSVVL